MGRVFRFIEVGSTNDLARGTEYVHADVIIAERQSEGRGQRGNKWDSSVGENLTFSLVLEPSFLPAEHQFMLLETVALGISDMLIGYGIEPSIKWTNDIYVNGQKIAGVLMENDICGMNLSRSIVGIGLNVNQTEFPEWLPNPVSMAVCVGVIFDREEVLVRLHGAIMARYALLESGDTETLHDDYHRRLYLRNRTHRFTLEDGSPFEGTIRGVEPTGELCVESRDGVLRKFLFKEILF